MYFLNIILDEYIQQAKRKYADRSRYAMNAVSNELQDVTRIMVSNIEDVIHRGEALNSNFIFVQCIVSQFLNLVRQIFRV